MFEKFNGLRVKGCGFLETVELPILKYRFNVVYGRNGSGKSTIARAFRQIASVGDAQEGGGMECAELYGDGDAVLRDVDRERIFVFDQDYIDNNVRVKEGGEDGLRAIVMIGQQVANEDEINVLEGKIRSLEGEIAGVENDKEGLRERYEELKVVIEGAMKDGWSERDKVIKGNVRRSPLPGDLETRVLERMKGGAVEKRMVLQGEFDGLLKLYKNSGDMGRIEPWGAVVRGIDLRGLQGELKRTFKNGLDEGDRHLVGIIREMELGKLERIHDTFDKVGVERCPYCMREMDEDYRRELCRMIESVLDREASEYKEMMLGRLDSMLGDVALDYGGLARMKEFGDLVNRCEVCRGRLNGALARVRGVVERRIENLFAGYDDDVEGYGVGECLEELRGCVEAIRGRIEEHNRAVDNRAENRKRLDALNVELCCLEVGDKLVEKDGMRVGLRGMEGALVEKGVALGELRDELRVKRNAQQSIHVALNRINGLLTIVYGDKDRMQLVGDEHGRYEIVVNGRSVSPNRVSTGERNIIALCYFFTDLYRGEREKGKYCKERLVVIDDPISSFDMDNKVGVMSLMADQFNKIVYHNDNSRIVVLSHDLQTVNGLINLNDGDVRVRGARDLTKEERGKVYQHGLMILERGGVSESEHNKGKYEQMLEMVYDYVTKGHDAYMDLTIGNVMRRVVEAYSTFNYRCGMKQLFSDNKLLRRMGSDVDDYYRHRMFKLLLNESSHMEENVKDDVYLGFSKEDKVKTARDVLMFMYMLNDEHIVRYLGRERSEEIEQWCRKEFKYWGCLKDKKGELEDYYLELRREKLQGGEE